jgi:hypothetical protein
MVVGVARVCSLSFVLASVIAAQTALAADVVTVRSVGSLRAYADPQTGELVSPPSTDVGAGAASSQEPADADRLEVVPAPSRAGGVMIDLRGQFLHATRAIAAPDGTLSHECVPNSDAAREK